MNAISRSAPDSRVAIVATGAAFFMIVLDTSIVNLALPRIQDVFHADLTALQWLVDGYALVFASLLLNAGALGDRYGAKRVFSLGLLVFCAASAACGLAPNMASLQCARALQGISAAMLLPNSLAALSHTVENPDRRKMAVSAWASAGGLGVAMGPMIGGVLVQYLDWRSIFLVNVPVGLGGVWLARRHVAPGPRQTRMEFDLVGQALAVATLATLTYWMISVGRSHAFSIFAILLGLAVLLLGVAFLAVESRQARPMLPLDLLFRPALGSVAVVGLLHNVGIYGLIFALSLAFQELRGMTPVGAGLLFLPMTLTLAFGTRVGAKLLKQSDPFGPQIWGHAAAALGAGILATIGFDHSLAAIAIPLCVIGLGGGITTPSMNLSALEAVERERSGLASGILNSARQTGGVIGVALLGTLVGAPATAAGAGWAAVAAAIALAGASVLAAKIARQHRASTTLGHYLVRSKDPAYEAGRVAALNGDVLRRTGAARFHLSNDARQERINSLGNPSSRGIKAFYSIMVNYLYDSRTIEANHEAFANYGTVARSPEVDAVLKGVGVDESDARPNSVKTKMGD